jgi:hypothetical protein
LAWNAQDRPGATDLPALVAHVGRVPQAVAQAGQRQQRKLWPQQDAHAQLGAGGLATGRGGGTRCGVELADQCTNVACVLCTSLVRFCTNVVFFRLEIAFSGGHRVFPDCRIRSI